MFKAGVLFWFVLRKLVTDSGKFSLSRVGRASSVLLRPGLAPVFWEGLFTACNRFIWESRRSQQAEAPAAAAAAGEDLNSRWVRFSGTNSLDFGRR